MRSAFVVAAFAAGALAVPLMEREVVWETDVVYATQYVTVTAGDVAPTAAPPAYSTSSEHWGHRKKKTSSSSKSKTRSKPKPTSYSSTASSNDSAKDSPKATSSSSDVEEAAKETAWAYSWSTSWSESAPAATSAQEQAPPAYTPEKSEPAPTSYDAPKSYSETPTSTKAASSSNAKPTGYQGMVLHHHNIHRQNHSAPDIAWSDSLAATAQKIGETCVYAHNQYELIQPPRVTQIWSLTDDIGRLTRTRASMVRTSPLASRLRTFPRSSPSCSTTAKSHTTMASIPTTPRPKTLP